MSSPRVEYEVSRVTPAQLSLAVKQHPPLGYYNPLIPPSNGRANIPPDGKITVYLKYISHGNLRLPPTKFALDVLSSYNIGFSQLHPYAWQKIIIFEMFFRGQFLSCEVDVFRNVFELKRLGNAWYTFDCKCNFIANNSQTLESWRDSFVYVDQNLIPGEYAQVLPWVSVCGTNVNRIPILNGPQQTLYTKCKDAYLILRPYCDTMLHHCHVRAHWPYTDRMPKVTFHGKELGVLDVLKKNNLGGVTFHKVKIPDMDVSKEKDVIGSGGKVLPVTESLKSQLPFVGQSNKRKRPEAVLMHTGDSIATDHIPDKNLKNFMRLPSQGGYYVNPFIMNNQSPESQWQTIRQSLLFADGTSDGNRTIDAVDFDPDRLVRKKIGEPSTQPPIVRTTTLSSGIIPPNYIDMQHVSKSNVPPNVGSSSGSIRCPEFSNLESILLFPNDDAKIVYDWIDQSVPKNLADYVGQLNAVSIKSCRIEQQMICNALCREFIIRSRKVDQPISHEHKERELSDEIKRLTDDLKKMEEKKDQYRKLSSDNMRLIKDVSDHVERLKVDVKKLEGANRSLKEENDVLKAEAVSANEARIKAENDLLGTRDLAEKEQQACKDLDFAHMCLAEANISLEKQDMEIQALKKAEMETSKELEMLRTGIPALFYKALQSDALKSPFERALTETYRVGAFEMIKAVSQINPIPDPAPACIADMVHEDCYDKQVAALNELENLTVPLIDRIGGQPPLSVEEIMRMDPNNF